MRLGRSVLIWLLAVGVGAFGVDPSASSATGTAGPFHAPTTERLGLTETSYGGSSAPPRYIVRTRDTTSLTSVEARLANLGVRPSAEWSSAMFGVLADLDAVALGAILRDPAVVSVERDLPVHASASEASPPWGLDRIDQRPNLLDGMYDYTQTGNGVTAYVIDTGLWLSHEEFVGRVPRSAYWDFGDGTKAWDCNGHGTHVSGTLGGTAYGVAKAVSIVPVKVLDCAGSGTDASVISGINWVVGDHTAGVPAVANLSLGGVASAAVDAAVQTLIADGVTVVVAAGNDSAVTCGYSPARVAAAITVAASDPLDDRAAYSNHGVCNDLFAPGNDVLSAFVGSDTATAVLSGTSMATPHVSGVAAQLLEVHPTATPAQIWSMIDADSTTGALTVAVGDPNKLLFTTHEYPLTVATSGSGSGAVQSIPTGIDCGVTCSATFPSFSTTTLTAAPSSGSFFVGWSGAGCSGTGTCSVAMDGAKVVTATFDVVILNQLTVSTTGTGIGMVSSSPAGITCPGSCNANFVADSAVTLTASAAAGSLFVGWSGSDCVGLSACSLTMNATKNVTAVFDLADIGPTLAGAVSASRPAKRIGPVDP